MQIMKCNLDKHCYATCKHNIQLNYGEDRKICLCDSPTAFTHDAKCSMMEAVDLVSQLTPMDGIYGIHAKISETGEIIMETSKQ